MEPVNLKFATNDVGTSWYLLGGAAGTLLQANLPSGSRVDVLPYAAGVANNILVSNGSVDIACSFTLTAKLAYVGNNSMYATKLDNLRLLAAPIDQYWFGVAVPKDSDIQSFNDIINPKRAIRIGTSTTGGLAEAEFKLMLEAYNLTYRDLQAKGVTILYTSFPTIQNEINAKRLDVVIWVVNPGHPTWSAMFVSPGLRWIPLPDTVVNYLVSKYGLKADTLRAGLFSGSNAAATVGFYTVLVVRSDMSDALAYNIVKILDAGKSQLVAAYPASSYWNATQYKDYAVIPYHPGALKYYSEHYGG
jgi:hypothetical protein